VAKCQVFLEVKVRAAAVVPAAVRDGVPAGAGAGAAVFAWVPAAPAYVWPAATRCLISREFPALK